MLCAYLVRACLILSLGLGVASAMRAQDGPTPIERFTLPPGFKVELLYGVPRQDQGSWVSMTVDGQGRLIASDQYGKLYRITPSPIGSGEEGTVVEELAIDIGTAHGLLYAFDSLYVMVNESQDKSHGLYRLKDTNGDDQFDEVKFLRAFEGGGEHGPHAIVLGPDNMLYLAAGNHTKLVEAEKSLVPRVWEEDLLLPRMWDAGGHAVDILAPGGYIARTDPEGQEFQVFGIGYRNQYDMAFNDQGELFTYDSDMEWDIGMPWYRPTRICHSTSGSDFGWRSGSANAPEYYADNLPPVVNIGPGSPTGVVFGTGARFPKKYQKALYACDWSYGIIYAITLEPEGSSYKGTLERFASASPLPVTDLVINPHDGAMYFAIGGRRTQSALYRIVYTGEESTEPAAPTADAGTPSRRTRRDLESLHSAKPDRSVVQKAWPHLRDADPFIRFAARVAIEHQPIELWREKALAETDATALMEAAIALSHMGNEFDQPKLVAALDGIDWAALTTDQQLDLLRVYGLTFIRLGQPDAETAARLGTRFSEFFPTSSPALNRELASMLVYLNYEGVVPLAIDQMYTGPTQEDRIHYAFILRTQNDGWSLENRKKYLEWYRAAATTRGGMSFGGFLKNTRNEAITTFTNEERAALKDLIEENIEARPVEEAIPPRAFVKKWTVDELLPIVDGQLEGRDFARGQRLFADASCFRCHRLAGEGGINGPDLTAVGNRFNNRDLLESLVEPSKAVSDQYAASVFVLSNGRTIQGRVINLFGDNIMVLTNMLDPSNLAQIKRDRVEESHISTVSMMPEGLLDTLNEEEILDLVAFLRSGGDPNSDMFK